MSSNPPTVAAVLAGTGRYDDLGAKEQAVVRDVWAQRIESRRHALNLAADFVAEGRTWVDLEDLPAS